MPESPAAGSDSRRLSSWRVNAKPSQERIGTAMAEPSGPASSAWRDPLGILLSHKGQAPRPYVGRTSLGPWVQAEPARAMKCDLKPRLPGRQPLALKDAPSERKRDLSLPPSPSRDRNHDRSVGKIRSTDLRAVFVQKMVFAWRLACPGWVSRSPVLYSRRGSLGPPGGSFEFFSTSSQGFP